MVELANISQRILKHQFTSLEPDDRGINASRGYACEIVAWRFLSSLTEQDALDYLLSDLPKEDAEPHTRHIVEPGHGNGLSNGHLQSDENAPLLGSDHPMNYGQPIADTLESGVASQPESFPHHGNGEPRPADPFGGLNALEIAVIVGAKKFISQPSVQRIVKGIWKGDIIFWQFLSVDCKKKPQIFNRRYGSVPMIDDRPPFDGI